MCNYESSEQIVQAKGGRIQKSVSLSCLHVRSVLSKTLGDGLDKITMIANISTVVTDVPGLLNARVYVSVSCCSHPDEGISKPVSASRVMRRVHA